MNLSWFEFTESQTSEDLLDVETTVSVSYAGSLVSYKDFWIQNNGNEEGEGTLVDFGLYVSANDRNDLIKVLKLASEVDGDDLPCGLFLVFGYDEESNSYIDKIPEGIYSAEEAAKFQVNWTQGTTQLNKITLNSAQTFNGTGYSTRTNLPVSDEITNTDSETRGRIKVRLVLKAKEGGETLLSKISVNASVLGEI